MIILISWLTHGHNIAVVRHKKMQQTAQTDILVEISGAKLWGINQ